jgi:hypothetical protein
MNCSEVREEEGEMRAKNYYREVLVNMAYKSFLRRDFLQMHAFYAAVLLMGFHPWFCPKIFCVTRSVFSSSLK